MLSLGLVVTLFFPSSALAVESVPETVVQTLGTFATLMIKLLNSFLWPFLLLIGELMDNDLILGGGMEDSLRSIWIPVRDLVNIVFVIVLMIIAFYNALPFTDSEGNFALKTALPRLILGLVLVNFTFLGGRIALDMSNLATTAAFALPEVVDSFDFTDQKNELVKNVCLKDPTIPNDPSNPSFDANIWDADEDGVPIFTKLLCASSEQELSDGTSITRYVNSSGVADVTPYMQATYFQDLNANNVGLIMAVNMGSLESLKLLKPEAITGFDDLVANTLFSLIMYVVFAVSYIVLGIVLVTRVVVIWIAMALSPIAVLIFVVPQLRDAIGGGGGDVVQQITKNLLAPAIIGVTMTIGYIMIDALATVSGGISNFSIAENDLFSEEFFASGIHDMERFLLSVASVVVVWVGVFAAAKGTIAESVTEGIKGFGERAAGALARAPLYLPITPFQFTNDQGEETNVSPYVALNLGSQTFRALETGSFAQGNVESAAKAIGIDRVLGYSGGGNIDQDLRRLSRNRGKISASTVDEVANKLFQNAKRNGADAEIQRQLGAINSKTDPAVKLNELKRLFDKSSGNNAEKLKLDEQVFKDFQIQTNDINWQLQTQPEPSPTNAQEPPTTPTPTQTTPPAPSPVQVAGLSLTDPTQQSDLIAALA